jgi:hypothetical protein
MPSLRPKFSLQPLLAVLALTAGPLQAQDLTVTGSVTSGEGLMGIGGASVQIKGTDIGVLTTLGGSYSINLRSASDTLVFTRLGLETQEVPVDGRSVLNIDLAQSPQVSPQGIIVRRYRAQPRMMGANSNCARTFSPMPGSAYDPNWQGENPELARLMLPRCNPVATPSHPIPQAPPGD